MPIPVSSPFGARRNPVTKRWHRHAGIDIPMAIGTPVRAAGSGVVSRIDRDGVGKGVVNGNAIALRLRSGLTAWYLHLSRILVAVGQTVPAHTVIGLSGDTGRSTGPHLHFAVMTRGGVMVDPVTFYPPGTFRRV